MKRLLAVITALTGLISALRWLSSLSAKDDAASGYQIRDAGPENMSNPPAGWDITDQVGDGSFPAIDPPSGY